MSLQVIEKTDQKYEAGESNLSKPVSDGAQEGEHKLGSPLILPASKPLYMPELLEQLLEQAPETLAQKQERVPRSRD
jgi:hypothetical protein